MRRRCYARAAGVEATRTALLQVRHVGSREGLLAATAECASDRVDSERADVEPGDAAAAAAAVCAEYEAYGDDILRLLQEGA